MRISNRMMNITLGVVVIVLLWLCVESILDPLRFGREKAGREKAVKERLVRIREAEKRFMAAHGSYCASLDSLVSGGWLDASDVAVPYGDGRKFRVAVTVVMTETGRPQPVMECGARYEDYLRGLDRSSVAALTEEAIGADRYPGLKFGSLSVPGNNAGNWEQ